MTAPPQLPSGLKPGRRTPSFTDETVPDGLARDHTTKAGTWGVIHVEEGRLRYCVPSRAYETEIAAGEKAVIEPEVPHHVAPVGAVTFFVEFWTADAEDEGLL